MDGLIAFGVTAGVAAVVVAIVRAVWGTRGERALFRLADRTTPVAAHSRIIATLGTSRPAENAGFEARRHRASPGVKGLATGIAALLFYAADTMLQEAAGHDTGAATGKWMALGGLALLGWYLAWVWTYWVEVSRDTLRVPTLAFGRRSLPLDWLIRCEHHDPHFLRLQFRDGRRAQVLKYLTGRADLEAMLAHRVAQNEERGDRGACRNYPRSRRSAAGSNRF